MGNNKLQHTRKFKVTVIFVDTNSHEKHKIIFYVMAHNSTDAYSLAREEAQKMATSKNLFFKWDEIKVTKV